MSHEHRDYLVTNMRAMRRVEVDRTTVLNGEGLTLWLIIVENVQTSSLYMSLNSLSEATGIAKQNVRKRMAVFVEAGWLIERGFEKHGKYAKTKTYEVVLDVLGVGQATYPQRESHGTSRGTSRGRSHGESRNIANTTQEREMPSNPIPNTNPTPSDRENSNNFEPPRPKSIGEGNERIKNIVDQCINMERARTPNIGRPLEAIMQKEYTNLVAAEMQCREWLDDSQLTDVCYAKRNNRTPPNYERPACPDCGGKNRDIEGLETFSTIAKFHEGSYVYIVCPTCNGDGWRPLKHITRTMFPNLNSKGKTQ
jgi:hypothetical protein